MWRLAPVEDGDRILLPVVDAFRPVYRLATAVRDGAYAGLFPRFPNRWRRLDWHVGVSPSVAVSTGRRAWDDLQFPGERPSGRAAAAVPQVPAAGYARDRLRDQRQRTRPERIVEVALRHMLAECGYDDVDAAIADTVDGLPESPAPAVDGPQEARETT